MFEGYKNKQKYYIWFLIKKNNVYVVDSVKRINPNAEVFKDFPLDINNASLELGTKNIYLFDKNGQLGIIKGKLTFTKNKSKNEQLKIEGIQLPEFSKEFIDLILLKHAVKHMFNSLKEVVKKFDWLYIVFLALGVGVGYIISTLIV